MRASVIAVAVVLALLATCGLAAARSLQPGTPGDSYEFRYDGYVAPGTPQWASPGNWFAGPGEDLLLCDAYGWSCVIYARNDTFPSWTNAVRITLPTSGTTAAAFVGDLNGDGLEDVAVGRPYESGESNYTSGGRVRVFLSKGEGGPSTLYSLDADAVILGGGRVYSMGSLVSRAGDVDGDGYDDFWVGAIGTNSLFLFRGAGDFGGTMNASRAAVEIQFSYVDYGFNEAVLGGVDLDDDGAFDLVVGRPSARVGVYQNAGAVFAFMGPIPTDGRIVDAFGESIQIAGEATDQRFGQSLAFSHSFAADGRPLLFIGDPAGAGGGRILAFDTSGWDCCAAFATTQAFGSFVGNPTWGFPAGSSFATGADIDGDGSEDMVIGVSGAPSPGSNGTGRIFLFYGAEWNGSSTAIDGAVITIDAAPGQQSIGRQVRLADVTGDGLAEIFAGAGTYTSDKLLGYHGRPRNRAPVITLRIVGAPAEGVSVTAQADAGDADEDPLSWAWRRSSSAAFGAFGASSELAISLPDDGAYYVAVTVTDGQLAAEANITFVVENAPPSCSLDVGQPFVEATLGVIALSVTNPNPNEPWKAEWEGPFGLAGLGSLGYYRPSDSGSFSVRVTVTDDDGGSGSCALEVAVANLPPSLTLSGPAVLVEGGVGFFLARATDPSVLDSVGVSWDLPSGDIHPVTWGVNWSTSRPGSYTVRATATDKDGGSVSQNFSFRVLNRPLDVYLDFPARPVEGTQVNISVFQLSGAEWDTFQVTWRVCAPGSAHGARYEIPRAPPGPICVNATVTSEDGDFAVFEDMVKVVNRPPLEGIALPGDSPHRFVEGEWVSVGAVVGWWETSVAVEYAWMVDGRHLGDNLNLTFRAVAGEHELTVVAFDGQGGSNSFGVTFEVANRDPTIQVSGPIIIGAGTVGVWNATASDPSGLPPRIRWELNGQTVAFGPSFALQFDEAGLYTLRAVADDGHGGMAVKTLQLTVTEAPPPSVSTSGTAFPPAVVLGLDIAAGGALLWAWRRRREPEE